jgi:hypothetical protein
MQASGRRRALVFPAVAAQHAIMLDSAALIRLLPTEVRPPLRENDLVFVEGYRVEQDTVYLTVWGYGQRDPNGSATAANTPSAKAPFPASKDAAYNKSQSWIPRGFLRHLNEGQYCGLPLIPYKF